MAHRESQEKIKNGVKNKEGGLKTCFAVLAGIHSWSQRSIISAVASNLPEPLGQLGSGGLHSTWRLTQMVELKNGSSHLFLWPRSSESTGLRSGPRGPQNECQEEILEQKGYT